MFVTCVIKITWPNLKLNVILASYHILFSFLEKPIIVNSFLNNEKRWTKGLNNVC